MKTLDEFKQQIVGNHTLLAHVLLRALADPVLLNRLVDLRELCQNQAIGRPLVAASAKEFIDAVENHITEQAQRGVNLQSVIDSIAHGPGVLF